MITGLYKANRNISISHGSKSRNRSESEIPSALPDMAAFVLGAGAGAAMAFKYEAMGALAAAMLLLAIIIRDSTVQYLGKYRP